MAELKKLRTTDQAFEEIKKMDPQSAITRCFIRKAIMGGDLPFIQTGCKRLIDLDDLIEFINRNMKDMGERQGVR